ncbi:MAG: DUF2490 domain-containing protein [Sinobacteraceae bacterium]|nr:DUF2490 domain-containing protein [Nevskiaceae bacterium]
MVRPQIHDHPPAKRSATPAAEPAGPGDDHARWSGYGREYRGLTTGSGTDPRCPAENPYRGRACLVLGRGHCVQRGPRGIRGLRPRQGRLRVAVAVRSCWAFTALVLAWSALLPPAAGAASSETNRINYQIARPIKPGLRFGALVSLSETPASVAPGDRTTLAIVPAGVDYKIDERWSAQSYLQVNKDFYSLGSDKVEIRPVLGLTYRFVVTPRVETGFWLRYEARFQDVTGDGNFQNRMRLRPYLDFKFGADPGKPGTWHARTEYEPRYVFGNGASFFNSQQIRQAVGYKFSNRLTIDLRYSRDFSRRSTAEGFSRSNEAWTLQFNQVWVPN